jgi:hypothetical protein
VSNIAIKGNASGTGTFTVEAPNSNTDRTLTLPDEAGTVLTSASTLSSSNLSGALPALDGSALTGVSAGKVLQVVSTLKQNTFTTTTALGSGTNITGLTTTITPSSTSSKILVMFTGYGSPSTSNYTIGAILERTIGGTPAYPYLGDARGSASRISAGTNAGSGDAKNLNFTFLDSPNTTSQITYNVAIGGETSALTYLIGGSFASGASYLFNIPTTLTLMEIDPS